MARQRGTARAVIGVFNVLFGALAVWGGGQFLTSFREASALGLVIAAAGLVAGACFAIAGVAVWRGWPQARAFGLSASAVTIVVYAAGVAFGIIGFGGLLYGVAYPALVMAWLARPGSGAGRPAEDAARAAGQGADARDLRRMETALA